MLQVNYQTKQINLLFIKDELLKLQYFSHETLYTPTLFNLNIKMLFKEFHQVLGDEEMFKAQPLKLQIIYLSYQYFHHFNLQFLLFRFHIVFCD